MRLFRKLLYGILLVGGFILIFNHFNLYSYFGYDRDDSRVVLDEGEISILENIDTSGYIYLPMEESDISKGELILVNNNLSYPFTDDMELVSVYDSKNAFYKVKDLNVTLHKSVMEPLNDMLKEFQNHYKSSGITIISGHRTYDYQESLYQQKIAEDGEIEAMKWVAQPGGSEHHTGYALDFGLYNKGRSEPYIGTGPYSWINENSHYYGFIVRYPEEKSELTGIEYEPWHFRFIGKPHSYIIYKYNMCMEEYIDYLKQFQFGKKHLYVISNGEQYEIYFTYNLEVPVPKDRQYKISGNNVDGFIVTIEN